MNRLVLAGCRPEPLGRYLCALGAFRAIATQADPAARGCWRGDHFVLHTTLDEDALIAFFLRDWAPAPILTPWSGGSGFFPGDQRAGFDAIAASTQPRFAPYRAALSAAAAVLRDLNLAEKPDKTQKPALLARLRDTLPDAALDWLDAAVMLGEDRLLFPPLLGTGGNDGRLDFANNQMQRLAELLLPAPAGSAAPLLRASLLGQPCAGLARDKAVGQFLPAAAGGANASEGFDDKSLLNPWDYLLMLEGALLFAAAASRRYAVAERGGLAYPFTVRAVGAGYGSASATDEASARHELWLPLWRAPATFGELAALFTEGRARLARRSATTGVEFARALATLGVDRGIHSFARTGFLLRNGLSYFATPLGRWRVQRRRVGRVEALSELDPWLADLRRAAGTAASLARALRAVEEAMLALCQPGAGPAQSQALLIAVAEADGLVARARGAREAVRPAPRLHARWARLCDDGSPELRLAAALATTAPRQYIVPIDTKNADRWSEERSPPRVVWTPGRLEQSLIALSARRAREEAPPPAPRFTAPLSDLYRLVTGQLDGARLERLCRALVLVSPRLTLKTPPPPSLAPPLCYTLLALAAHRVGPEGPLPATPGLLARAAAGHDDALALAARRLSGAGWPLGCGTAVTAPPDELRRAAAALAFPLSDAQHRALIRLVVRRSSDDDDHDRKDVSP